MPSPPDASNQSDSASQQRNCDPLVGQPSEPSMASAMVHEAPQNPVSLGDTCVDNLVAGDWLSFLPGTVRKPVAGCGFYVLVAASAMLLFAPWADSRGEAYLNATFTRTLGALAATRGLDSAISLAQSSEVSFSFGPGGSLGIGQALDPVNDLVEQYGSLLLTSTTALGVQRLGMQIGRALGWWLFLPPLLSMLAASAFGGRSRASLTTWGRRLFGIALFVRLAIPTSAWIDSLVSEQFLEANYQQASAAVTNTTEKIEQVESDDAGKPWYERYNPIEYVGDRAHRLYEVVGDVGESIVNLAIYFTISTIVLPLATLWLLAKLSGSLFSVRGP